MQKRNEKDPEQNCQINELPEASARLLLLHEDKTVLVLHGRGCVGPGTG